MVASNPCLYSADDLAAADSSRLVILFVVVVLVVILVVILIVIHLVIHLVASNPCLYSADDLAGGSRRHGLTGHLTAAAGDSAVDLGREHRSRPEDQRNWSTTKHKQGSNLNIWPCRQ